MPLSLKPTPAPEIPIEGAEMIVPLVCIGIFFLIVLGLLAWFFIVMNRGEVYMDGAPREVFSRGDDLRAIGLDVPQAVELAQRLRERGLPVPEGVYREEELQQAIEAILGKGESHA